MATHEELMTSLKFDESFRNALRNYYNYGFKKIRDYDPQKVPTMNNDWERLNNLLFGYLEWSEGRGKDAVRFATQDSVSMEDNPFHKLYKFCKFNYSDPIAFFNIVIGLSDKLRIAGSDEEPLYERLDINLKAEAKKRPYAMNSGVSDITIVDMDAYEYWNLPRSSMVNESSLRRPKALELARAAAERSCFSINVTGINANICDLGWGFFEQFDLVLSPVDSAAVRQYIDRGCKLYHIPHITCGTGTIGDQFTGNVVSFPADSVVDLEYVWGNGYRQTLEERRSCSDIPDETQAQVMGFSAQIAGMTMDLALKYLLGKTKDVKTAWKYILNSVGNGFVRDKVALRTFKYGKLPTEIRSELFDALTEAEVIHHIEFDRTHPKHELWEKMNAVFQEDIPSYRLDLEWSLNIPVAYRSTDAYAKIEVPEGCGVDPVLLQLPKEHIYLVEGDEHDYLVKLCFTDEEA